MTGHCKDCGYQVCECDSETHPKLNHCGQDTDHIEDVRGMVDEPRNGRRDREADRERFPDPEFNRWLDEGISDGGHTVWDALASVCDAWHGWENRQYYAAPTPPKSEPIAWLNKPLNWKRHQSETIEKLTKDRQAEYGFVYPVYSQPFDRDAVIEECARWFDTHETALFDGIQAAKYVRSLKSQPAQPDPKDEALRLEVEKLRFGLENCRLLAARHRKEDWALLVLGFCAEAEVVGSVTR